MLFVHVDNQSLPAITNVEFSRNGLPYFQPHISFLESSNVVWNMDVQAGNVQQQRLYGIQFICSSLHINLLPTINVHINLHAVTQSFNPNPNPVQINYVVHIYETVQNFTMLLLHYCVSWLSSNSRFCLPRTNMSLYLYAWAPLQDWIAGKKLVIWEEAIGCCLWLMSNTKLLQ